MTFNYLIKGPGVTTKSIYTSLNPAGTAGTAYVIFENVKVPISNLLANENEGFKAIMVTFY
jgi:alkylation response protein AidB-like acyl-CoA dehydrogenase